VSDSISNAPLSEPNTQTSQLYQTTDTFASIRQNVTDSCNIADDFFSFEDLMDLLPLTADIVESTNRQDDDSVDTVRKDSSKQLISELSLF
jgi:hypothetical protein